MTRRVAYIEQRTRSTLQGQKRTESPAVYGVREDETYALQQRRRVRDLDALLHSCGERFDLYHT